MVAGMVAGNGMAQTECCLNVPVADVGDMFRYCKQIIPYPVRIGGGTERDMTQPTGTMPAGARHGMAEAYRPGTCLLRNRLPHTNPPGGAAACTGASIPVAAVSRSTPRSRSMAAALSARRGLTIFAAMRMP